MTRHRLVALGLVVLSSLLALAAASTRPAEVRADEPPVVRIGMLKSLFRDIPDRMMGFLTVPFSGLMYSQTGVKGQMVLIGDTFELADKMEKNEIQLGVFHGFEFAWAQGKNPKLKPLMIAVNQRRTVRALLVTRDDCAAETFAQLKGKEISIPKQSRGHCWLFVEKSCDGCGCNLDSFFAKVQRHANMEDALDDVVRGEVDCCVVDCVALSCYAQIKPGCHKRLKVVERSAGFPAATIAYREGHLDQETLDRFRTGMVNANKNAQARQLMTLCKLTGFEEVPEDYQQQLDAIRRSYPSPEAAERKVSLEKTAGQ